MQLSYLFLGQSFDKNLTIIAKVTRQKCPIEVMLLKITSYQAINLDCINVTIYGVIIYSNARHSFLTGSIYKISPYF